MAGKPKLVFQRAEINTAKFQHGGKQLRFYVWGGVVSDPDGPVQTGRGQVQVDDMFFTDTSLEGVEFSLPADDVSTLRFLRGQYGNPIAGYKTANLEVVIDDKANTVKGKITDEAGRVLFETPSPISVGTSAIRVSQVYSTPPVGA